jgi:hypothetical protein
MAGLLSRLFGGSSSGVAAPNVWSVGASLYEGYETLEVVGESHYQDTLWQIVGGRQRESVRYETHALLVPEPNNEYDPNAIQVRIDGELVGYLSREDAAVYRPGLLKLMESSTNHLVALRAAIVGGGPRSDGIGFLGVFLDHDPSDFGVAPHHVSTGHSLRTGLSDAIATDLDDDSYDLSWYTELSEDDVAAIGQLRSALESTADPIDRHYMLCELEHRVYRCRNVFPSALDEFDAVCRQHDQGMDTIRPALLDKFGAIPVIDMYRQVVIRCQKAKLWQAAREWAQRGVDIYGDQAARPEVVEDLHQRIAHATAKLEAARRPSSRKPRHALPELVPKPAALETFVCASCSATFERPRTRGRKPKICPTCRGLATPVATA